MKKERGITLIALVITIIVLLILAGVSLRLVVDEDGILERTTTAVDKMNKETDKEEVEMAVLGIKMKYYEEGKPGSLREYMIRNLNEYKTANGTIRCDEVGNVTYVGNGVVTGKIDENGNFELTKEGIVITPASIKLEMKKDEDLPTATLTANLIEVSGEISWTSANPNVVTVSGNGETAIVKAVDEGTTIITAKCGNYEATCTIEVTKVLDVESVIGGFVHYDVSYTDIYANYNYTADNGWRIMNLTDKGNGTYDVDIISTGMPAGVYYYYGWIPEFTYDGEDGKWIGNREQREKYANNFYASTSITNDNMGVAAGLCYNFEKIWFEENVGSAVSYNYGFFTKIREQTLTSPTTGGILFRTEESIGNKITGIRSVMLSDLTGDKGSGTNWIDKAKGLFDLRDLTKVENAEVHQVATKHYNLEWYYWLGSPYPDEARDLYVMGYDGRLRGSGDNCYYGTRPVISISGVRLNQDSSNGVWKME